MTDSEIFPAPKSFDFAAPAELYIGRGTTRHHGLRFRQFETAAEALRFAIERPRLFDEVALMECDERRYTSLEMAELYNRADYPLERVQVRSPVRPAISVPLASARTKSAPRVPTEPQAGQAITATSGVRPRHRYGLGARLKMQHGGFGYAQQASNCSVTFVLPFEGRQLLYRVKSDNEAFERVVPEADLSPMRYDQ